MSAQGQDLARPDVRSGSSSRITAAVALMRPKQWVKNGFVLVPIFFSGHVDLPLALFALVAAASFCLLSSAIYIFNDLCDLEDDKLHEKKRFRPLPSGRIAVPVAVALGIGLALASVTVPILAGVPLRFFFIAGLFAACNLAYSLGMKHIPILELFILSSGYVLRLIAGSTIIGESPSSWIVVCTGLVSIMLAVGKRRGDVANALDQSGRRRSLQHYSLPYLDQLTTLLAAATFVTYLLFCISDYALDRFGADVTITSIFVLFGIFRFLQIVTVEAGGDSPTDIVVGDGPLRTSIGMWLLTFFVIIYLTP
jgi:decaprenyl-phosphate phosphoribosyltransferase